MGRITNEELIEACPNNYRASFEGEEYEYYAVSVRQAWYLAFQHFGDECLTSLCEIDEYGEVVDVLLDKEEIF